jgi:hypothetical protein
MTRAKSDPCSGTALAGEQAYTEQNNGSQEDKYGEDKAQVIKPAQALIAHNTAIIPYEQHSEHQERRHDARDNIRPEDQANGIDAQESNCHTDE